MAYSGEGIDLSFAAAEDLSGHQYRFVVLASDTAVRMLDAADEWPLGILQNDPGQGQEAVVRVVGVSKLRAGAGGLALGDRVGAEFVDQADNGKGAPTTTAGAEVRATVVLAASTEDKMATVIMSDFKY